MLLKSKHKGIIILGLAGFLLGCPPKAKRLLPPAVPATIISPNIAPDEVKRKLDAGEELILLDVRTNKEYAQGHLEGSTLIPLDQLGKRYQELDADQEIIVYCRSGRRSSRATKMLFGLGFPKVKNMSGGITAWPYAVVK